MLMYHLFYAVKNSKSSYTETKVYQFESDALKEAIKLNQCSNVKFVSIRCVDVKSISLSVLKVPDNCDISEPYLDKTKIDISDLNINTVNQFQHDNPPLVSCKTYNEYIQEHFNAKQQDKKNN